MHRSYSAAALWQTRHLCHTSAGLAELLTWTTRQQASSAPPWFAVEATGVYHKELASLRPECGKTGLLDARLLIRWARKPENYLALPRFACACITWYNYLFG